MRAGATATGAPLSTPRPQISNRAATASEMSAIGKGRLPPNGSAASATTAIKARKSQCIRVFSLGIVLFTKPSIFLATFPD